MSRLTLAVAIGAIMLLLATAIIHAASRQACRTRLASLGPPPLPRTRSIESLTSHLWVRTRRRWVPSEPTGTHLALLLDGVARRTASGSTLSSAVPAALSADARRTFAPVLLAQARGDPISVALGAQPITSPDLALVVHALTLAALGGNIVACLDRAAGTLRERAAILEERHVNSAQARLSAKVLTVLPLAFAAWTLGTSPDARRFCATPVGLACLAVGCALNAAGWFFLRRAIGRST